MTIIITWLQSLICVGVFFQLLKAMAWKSFLALAEKIMIACLYALARHLLSSQVNWQMTLDFACKVHGNLPRKPHHNHVQPTLIYVEFLSPKSVVFKDTAHTGGVAHHVFPCYAMAVLIAELTL